MSTQTVYFTNPTVISDLQSSVSTNSSNVTVLQSTTTSMSGSIASLNDNNKWSRGTPVSMELVRTISTNGSTGPIWSWQGPSQAVSVYKLTYYSTPLQENSVERMSATVYIPSTISTGTILNFTYGVAVNDNEALPGHQYFGTGDNGYWNIALGYAGIFGASATARARGNPFGLFPTAFGGAAPALGTNAVALLCTSAAAGMVIIAPDGVGFGQSTNVQDIRYFNTVFPQVDALRALRLAILRQPTIFNSFSFPSVLPIIQSGVSKGSFYGPMIALEFQPTGLYPTGLPWTVSPTMSLDEVSKFTFQKILMPICPETFTRVSDQLNDSWSINTELFVVLNLAFLQGNNNLQVWNYHALQTIAPLFNQSDITQFISFQNELDKAIKLDTNIYPPSSTGWGLWNEYTGPNVIPGKLDLRQIFTEDALRNATATAEFHRFNGVLNPFKYGNGMSRLQNIPMVVFNAQQDTVTCTRTSDGLTGTFIRDSAEVLDTYFATGPVFGQSTPYQVCLTGALKTISTGAYTCTDASTFVSMQNSIASAARAMPNNEFLRFLSDVTYFNTTTYTRPQNLGTHSNYGNFAGYNIIRSILTGETIPF